MDSYGAFPALASKQNLGSTRSPVWCPFAVIFHKHYVVFPFTEPHDSPYLLLFHSRRSFLSHISIVKLKVIITLY